MTPADDVLLLAGARVVALVVVAVALALAGLEGWAARAVLTYAAQRAIVGAGAGSPSDIRDVVENLEGGVRHYRNANGALWVALCAGVCAWWLW